MVKLELLDPVIDEYFKKTLGFSCYTPVQMSSSSDQHKWGDYYVGGRKKRPWSLELVHSINQMLPSFNEVFDEETFYFFAFCIVVGSFLVAFFLARICKIRIREYPVHIDREWRDWRPANPFRFPWNDANKPNIKQE